MARSCSPLTPPPWPVCVVDSTHRFVRIDHAGTHMLGAVEPRSRPSRPQSRCRRPRAGARSHPWPSCGLADVQWWTSLRRPAHCTSGGSPVSVTRDRGSASCRSRAPWRAIRARAALHANHEVVRIAAVDVPRSPRRMSAQERSTHSSKPAVPAMSDHVPSRGAAQETGERGLQQCGRTAGVPLTATGQVRAPGQLRSRTRRTAPPSTVGTADLTPSSAPGPRKKSSPRPARLQGGTNSLRGPTQRRLTVGSICPASHGVNAKSHRIGGIR